MQFTTCLFLSGFVITCTSPLVYSGATDCDEPVCLSVCPLEYVKNHMCRLGEIFCTYVARWYNGKAFGLAISRPRSQVQILLEATLRNNLRQVVYSYVPLSPSSIAWYRPKGGDALRLGR